MIADADDHQIEEILGGRPECRAVGAVRSTTMNAATKKKQPKHRPWSATPRQATVHAPSVAAREERHAQGVGERVRSSSSQLAAEPTSANQPNHAEDERSRTICPTVISPPPPTPKTWFTAAANWSAPALPVVLWIPVTKSLVKTK